MQLPRFRFRIRTLLIAIASLACAIEGRSSWTRHVEYKRQAVQHAGIEWVLTGILEKGEQGPLKPQSTISAYLKRLLKYHSSMRQKYQYAAAHPWLFVPPDPPFTD